MSEYKLKNGQTLVIEKAVVSDAAKICEYISIIITESDNMTTGEGEFTLTVEEEEKYLEGKNEQENAVTLVAKIDGRLVGMASLTSSLRSRIAHNTSFGVSVLKEVWGNGIGEYLTRECIEFAKNNSIIEIIRLEVRVDNESAIRLYKRCGFEQNGYLNSYFKINDDYYDCLMMELNLK